MSSRTYVDVRASTDDTHAAVRSVCRELLGDEWLRADDATLAVTTISGGITNCLYKVSRSPTRSAAPSAPSHSSPTSSPTSVLVRVFGEKTELLIDREKDNALFAALARTGFGPPYHGLFANGRVEGFLPSRPLQPSEMASQRGAAPLPGASVVALIARETARMHGLQMPEAPLSGPCLWEKLDAWWAMAGDVSFSSSSSSSFARDGTAGGGGPPLPADPEKAAQLAALDVPRLAKELEWLKTVLPSPRNGHGADLLAAIAAEGATSHAPLHYSLIAPWHASATAVAVASSTSPPPAAAFPSIPRASDAVIQARVDGAALMFRVVFAHNDLLSGNILLVEGGGDGGSEDGAVVGEGIERECSGEHSSPAAEAGAGAGGGAEGGGVSSSSSSQRREDGRAQGVNCSCSAPSCGHRLYRTDRVQIIDYEYGAHNYAGFDLGNHFCEHAGFDFDLRRWYPSASLGAGGVQEEWLREYVKGLAHGGLRLPTRARYEALRARGASGAREEYSGGAAAEEGEADGPEDEVTRAFLESALLQANRFALASHLWWGGWAVIQARHSPIDFDFLGYAALRAGGYAAHKKEFFGLVV